MSIYSGIRMVFLLMAAMAFHGLRAQHYLFIEADGQQPFYLKQGDKMMSSSAGGFLILPRVTASEIEFSIGFPKNIYPEVSFYINGTDRDRGFQLKLMEGQVWSLFDRTSLEIIKGDTPKAAPVEMQLSRKDEGSFAKLLSAATDDKSLLENKPLKDSTEKPASKKPVAKSGLNAATAKPQVKDSISKKKQLVLPSISITKQTEDAAVKRLVYVEKAVSGSTDTISVEIEKGKITEAAKPQTSGSDTSIAPLVSLSAAPTIVSPDTIAQKTRSRDDTDSTKTNVQLPKSSPIVVCDRPIADYKDIRSLQKKLLGIASDEEQRIYAVKIFGQKCFNTKQVLEIGWLFVDEKRRLELFRALRPLISDKASFGNLEVSFLKEENIMAFRSLVAETN